MDAGGRHSASPEDRSDANETLSAPSEFLAEFLSAIMRRQYAEALKYCRLILQYEPDNATARGFYPLLRHKVLRQKPTLAGEEGTSSEEPSARSARSARSDRSAAPAALDDVAPQDESMEGDDRSECSSSSVGGGGSGASQSSLSLDSEGSASAEVSRRTDSSAAAAPGWDSSAGADNDDNDDNGNALLDSAPAPASAEDLENDNAAASGEPDTNAHFKKQSLSSLQRLRAQFTCSIK